MKALRTVVTALALVLPAAPAHAALIGLLGGNYDPPPITNSGPFGFVNCNEALAADPNHPDDPRFGANDYCRFYNAFNEDGAFVPFEEIFSLDFLLSFDRTPLQVGSNPVGDHGIITLGLSPLSDLRSLTNSDQFNPNGLLLSDGQITPGTTTFPPCSYEFDDYCETTTIEINAVALVLQLSSAEDFSLFRTSNLAVNGVAVPEPGTLLLLGPAAAALLMRRARSGRRRNQRTE